jgi:Protein of unknown function (DUF2934)
MPRAPKKTEKTNGNGNGNGNDVARKAYELYQSRGGGHGGDFDDWIEAEKQLSGSQPQQPLPPPAPAPERRKRTRAASKSA